MDRVFITLLHPAFSMVAALIGLDLFVQNASTTRVLQNRTTANAIAVATTQERKLIDSIQTIVVEFCAGAVLFSYEVGRGT
ncbi:hypothetical protein KCU61_g30, partial [Aureobasidium melanogenum]